MWRRTDNQEVGLEAATLERKRNSSLVKRLCADNSTGLKLATEAADSHFGVSGRGAFQVERSQIVRSGGPLGRDSAGTSSDKVRERRTRRKSKGSLGRLIRQGLVGP